MRRSDIAAILRRARDGGDAAWVTVAVLLFVASAWPSRLTMVDDAYISARYARLWAEGCGLRYSCDGPPTEGFTDFAWVVLLVPGTRLPLHLATWATSLGLLFGAFAVVAAWALARTWGLRGFDAAGPALLLAALPSFGVAATNGLETSLFLAAILWALALLRHDHAATGPTAALLYLVRPEGLAVGALVAVASRRARTVATWAVLVAAYFLARWAWFGTVVPNTWAAQAREGFAGMWAMNEAYLGAGTPVFAGVAVLALGALFGRARVLLVPAVGLALLALQVYNWMPGLRLFLVPIALVFVAVAPVLARRRWSWLGALTWMAWLQGDHRAQEVRYDAHNSVLPGNGGERLGRAIASVAPPGAWLLIRDAGVTAYYAGPTVNVIDIHPYSLTDPRLTGKPLSFSYLFEHDVAFVVTTGHSARETTQYPVETRLIGDPRVADTFARVGAFRQHHRRWYTLFARSDLAVRLAGEPRTGSGDASDDTTGDAPPDPLSAPEPAPP